MLDTIHIHKDLLLSLPYWLGFLNLHQQYCACLPLLLFYSPSIDIQGLIIKPLSIVPSDSFQAFSSHTILLFQK
jgi:hypothetical protein